MKKVLLLSNLGWMLITTMIITHGADRSIQEVASPVPGPLQGCPTDQNFYMNASHFIDGLARYKKYQLSAINGQFGNLFAGGLGDARSCWYSIGRLKNFICQIEGNAKGLRVVAPNDELGIRFYYATYPDTVNQSVFLGRGKNVDVNVAYHHTLFMVPTIHNNESQLEDDIFIPRLYRFNDRLSRLQRLQPLIHPQWQTLMKTPQATFLALGKTSINIPSSQNQGMLCPPTCPTDVSNNLGFADARAATIKD